MSVVLVLVVVDVLLSHGLTETSVEGARSKLWLRAAAAAACRAQQGTHQCNESTNKGAKQGEHLPFVQYLWKDVQVFEWIENA